MTSMKSIGNLLLGREAYFAGTLASYLPCTYSEKRLMVKALLITHYSLVSRKFASAEVERKYLSTSSNSSDAMMAGFAGNCIGTCSSENWNSN